MGVACSRPLVADDAQRQPFYSCRRKQCRTWGKTRAQYVHGRNDPEDRKSVRFSLRGKVWCRSGPGRDAERTGRPMSALLLLLLLLLMMMTAVAARSFARFVQVGREGGSDLLVESARFELFSHCFCSLGGLEPRLSSPWRWAWRGPGPSWQHNKGKQQIQIWI